MLKLKIPPVAVTLVFTALMWLVDRYLPNEWLVFEYQIWLIIGLAIWAGIMGVIPLFQFWKKSTSIDPHKPEKASSLVNTGIYRVSRNPMYLALALLLCCLALYLGNAFNLLLIPLFVWYMNRYQVIPEEGIMLEKFGDDFREYKSRVRRWI